jgi:hypothetical protein
MYAIIVNHPTVPDLSPINPGRQAILLPSRYPPSHGPLKDPAGLIVKLM